MIYIDHRRGSGELKKYFTQYGVDTNLTTLSSADFAFMGKGPDDEPVSVGIERKHIDPDLLDSMSTRRLAGYQLGNLHKDYNYFYIVVEGYWKVDKETDQIMIMRGRDEWVYRKYTSRQVHNFLFGLALRAGALVWRVGNSQEMATFVVDQYRMWNEPWSDHKSHCQIYAPGAQDSDDPISRRKGLFRRRQKCVIEHFAAQLPGVDSYAEHVAAHFINRYGRLLAAEKMMVASPDEWAEIRSGKGVRLGTKRAMEIVKAIRGS